MNNRVRLILKIIILIFAVIGFLFTTVFFAMQFKLLNVRGSISERNEFFNSKQVVQDKTATNTPKTETAQNPDDNSCRDNTKNICAWNETRESEVVKGGLMKDSDLINNVANEVDISPRLLASIVVPEQTRFFTAEREVFKRYFEPLKILGSLSKFSLGVSGIKQETAMLIEKYATDENTPFYPGKKYSKLLAYDSGVDESSELYKRLTDSKNHYYSYLYTAMFIKEIEAEWKHDGYDINNTPGAIITLFNLGFSKSHPNPMPHIGGAPITTGGNTYSYGELGLLFYNSNELSETFKK